MQQGSPDTLGATVINNGASNGVNFAIRSRAATRVEVCLYDPTGTRETARLTLVSATSIREGGAHDVMLKESDVMNSEK